MPDEPEGLAMLGSEHQRAHQAEKLSLEGIAGSLRSARNVDITATSESRSVVSWSNRSANRNT